MAPNEKLAELSEAGVAVWLDELSRDRIRSGDLQSLVHGYSVVGITTNPDHLRRRDQRLRLLRRPGTCDGRPQISVEGALRTITAADVRDACDLLAPVAQRTGRDGRVSLEVAPAVAHDTDATAAEAAHLWWLVDRPNLFIMAAQQVPAAAAPLAACPARRRRPFQQILKNWLRAQPARPATLRELQALPGAFTVVCNTPRPPAPCRTGPPPPPPTAPGQRPRRATAPTTPTTASAATASTPTASSPSGSAGSSTTSASAGPTPGPAS
jgi:Transaldolase/Fructose-6-phosphate aldolase